MEGIMCTLKASARSSANQHPWLASWFTSPWILGQHLTKSHLIFADIQIQVLIDTYRYDSVDQLSIKTLIEMSIRCQFQELVNHLSWCSSSVDRDVNGMLSKSINWHFRTLDPRCTMSSKIRILTSLLFMFTKISFAYSETVTGSDVSASMSITSSLDFSAYKLIQNHAFR